MAEINRNAYGRINKFLREGNNRGEEFTVREIAENTGLSPEEVKSTIKMVLKDKNERLLAGGPSIIEGKKDGSYCSRRKYLDKITR